jgi:hypothetical protein
MPEWVKGKKPSTGRPRRDAVSGGTAQPATPSPWVRGTVSPGAAAAKVGGPSGGSHRSTPWVPGVKPTTATSATSGGAAPGSHRTGAPAPTSTAPAPYTYSSPDVGGPSSPAPADDGYRTFDPDAGPSTYAYSTPIPVPSEPRPDEGYSSFAPVDAPVAYAYSSPASQYGVYRQLDDEAPQHDTDESSPLRQDNVYSTVPSEEMEEGEDQGEDDGTFYTLADEDDGFYTLADEDQDQESEAAEEQLDEIVQQQPAVDIDLDDLPEMTLGAATRLSRLGAQYANESQQDLKDRNDADILGAIRQLADTVKRLIALVAELETIDPADAGALAGFKSRLAPGARNATAAMDHPQLLAWLRTMRDDKAEMARREELPIDASGNLDPALLDARRVQYDTTPEQQAASEVTVSGSGLKRSASHASQPGGPVDTSGSVTHFKGNGYEIFVVGTGGDIHMASHKIAKFHHSSLLAGGDVSMAGEMKVHGGVIKEMSNKSGHYRPNKNQFHHFLEELRNRGLSLDFPVSGFGIADGLTGTQLVDQELDSSSEKDLEVVLEGFEADYGARAVTAKLTAPPPAGAGLRRDGGDYTRADGTEVGPVELRQILERIFGRPAKRKIYQQGQLPVFE